MLKKEIKLLQTLYQNKAYFLTASEIANAIGMSERTVRTYIQQVNKVLSIYGAEIIAKRGIGFKLEVSQADKFEHYFQTQITSNKLASPKTVIENRENYLLTRLLLNDSSVLFDTLMSELFISRSTLSKVFRKLKERLLPYQLTIQSRARKGVYISGSERDKRRFIMAYFFGQHYVACIQEYLGDTQFFSGIQLEAITLIIIEECRQAQLKIQDFVIQNLVLHLALSINRLQKAISLSSNEIGHVSETALAYQVAQGIITRVEALQNIKFPRQEVAFLALHLVSNSPTPTPTQEIAPLILEAEIRNCLITSQQYASYHFLEDTELISALIAHITAMQLRIRNGMVLVNPLLDKVKTNFAPIFQLTKDILSKMPHLSNQPISEDEWAYLTLHFMVAIEKAKDKQPIRVLVVCATGIGSAQLLKTRIEKTFGNLLRIVGLHGYFDLNQAMLQDVDVIISSIDLQHLVFTVPTVHVSIFLDNDDTKRVADIINTLRPPTHHFKYEAVSTLTLSQKRQICQQLFSADFFLKTSETQKSRVIESLLQKLAQQEDNNYLTKMSEQLESREQLSSIMFSDSIVVPHPVIPQGTTAKIAVAISEQGIKWDTDTIHFVFLLSPSKLENPHLTIATKAIVALLELPDVQSRLLKVDNFNDFIDLFLSLI